MTLRSRCPPGRSREHLVHGVEGALPTDVLAVVHDAVGLLGEQVVEAAVPDAREQRPAVVGERGLAAEVGSEPCPRVVGASVVTVMAGAFLRVFRRLNGRMVVRCWGMADPTPELYQACGLCKGVA